jgi:hypothetical protein
MEHKCIVGKHTDVAFVGIIPQNFKGNNNFCGNPDDFPEVKSLTTTNYNTESFLVDWNSKCKGK